MIVSVAVAVVISTLALVGADGILVDSSTVRMNYYKDLYLSGSHRQIECNGLAMLARMDAANTASCNDSDSDLLRASDCPGRSGSGAQMRPLVSSQTSVVKPKTRNLSMENEFSIRVENVTILRQPQEPKKKKIKGDEEGRNEEMWHFIVDIRLTHVGDNYLNS